MHGEDRLDEIARELYDAYATAAREAGCPNAATAPLVPATRKHHGHLAPSGRQSHPHLRTRAACRWTPLLPWNRPSNKRPASSRWRACSTCVGTSKLTWKVSMHLAGNLELGLIVGPTGCGKWTIARHFWPAEFTEPASLRWPQHQSLLDLSRQRCRSRKSPLSFPRLVSHRLRPGCGPFRCCPPASSFAPLARLLAEPRRGRSSWTNLPGSWTVPSPRSAAPPSGGPPPGATALHRCHLS